MMLEERCIQVTAGIAARFGFSLKKKSEVSFTCSVRLLCLKSPRYRRLLNAANICLMFNEIFIPFQSKPAGV